MLPIPLTQPIDFTLLMSLQGWREGPVTFHPTYKYHLGCSIYSGEPLPPALAAVRAVDSLNSFADSGSEGDPLDSAFAGSADRTVFAPLSSRLDPAKGPSSPMKQPGTPPASESSTNSAAVVEKQKRRTPAWCDRILWIPGRQLYQLAYGRGELAVSDHRPVAAAFLFEAHRYCRDKVDNLLDAARRQVDMSEMASRPK